MSEGEEPDFQFRLDVPFGPTWRHVELLRTSILHCVATIFHSHDFCEQLGMVAAELVENAIQYGHWTSERPQPFRLTVRGHGGSVSVEVRNPIDPEHDPVRLLDMLARLDAGRAPLEAYSDRLAEIAATPEGHGSGLGLLRIAYETGCRLEAAVDGRSVRVLATIAGESAAA